MKAIRIIITGIIEDYYPGLVECKFHDISGKEYIVQDKIPIFTDKDLDANSEYPQEGVIACKIINERIDKYGRKIVKVNTSPWGVETVDGLFEFDVLEEQLVELQL